MKLCPNPIIILGSPRSGTTALAWALAQHSQLWTSEESQLMLDLFGDGRLDKNYLRDGKGRGSWLVQQKIDRKDFLGYLGLGLNALFTDRAAGKRWVDHTPPYTMMVKDLADLFPGAQFLHILRDGRRVVHSMINYLKNLGEEGPTAGSVGKPSGPAWAEFRGACKTWSLYVRSAIEFCSANPTRGLTVVNEEMAANPRGQFKKILAFLQAPHEEAPAEFFRTNKMNSSFRRNDKRVDDPWNDWTHEQRTIFLEEAGDTMVWSGISSAQEIDTLKLACRVRQVIDATFLPDGERFSSARQSAGAQAAQTLDSSSVSPEASTAPVAAPVE